MEVVKFLVKKYEALCNGIFVKVAGVFSVVLFVGELTFISVFQC
jgi:hypothetical protein